ncbi:MAG: hypothetical protein RIQ99_689 [Pseudomonadota bacterium]|jgi:hypothetical protein
MSKRFSRIFSVLAVIVATPILAPQLLAFPYQAKIGSDHVWSTAPLLRPQLDQILQDANTRTQASPLALRTESRDIFLTDGGWRWLYLANTTHNSFALTRAFTNSVVINQFDPSTGVVSNGTGIGSKRGLAGVIAHEKCHGMVSRQFGRFVDVLKPQWLREGYCDYVAGESSLTAADVAALQAAGRSHPALPYYLGRQRVAATLAANGGNVERLFDEAR